MADDTKTKKAVAKHELLDASGNVVDKEELAHGVRYTQLSTGKSVDLIPQSEIAKRMLMTLGTKTLATNEASAHRQKNGDESDAIPDVVERFAGIENGTWLSGERTGPSWNLPAMRDAAILALMDAGKLDGSDEAGVAAKVKSLDALLTNPKAVAQVRAVAGVLDHYNRIVGKVKPTPKTVDDLLTLIA